jgi:hypothetical protein
MVYIALVGVLVLLYFIPPVKVRITGGRAVVYSAEVLPFDRTLSAQLMEYGRFLLHTPSRQLGELDYTGILHRAVRKFRLKLFLYYDLPLFFLASYLTWRNLRLSKTVHDQKFSPVEALRERYGLEVDPEKMTVKEIRVKYEELSRKKNIPINLVKRLYPPDSPDRVFLETGDERYVLIEIDPRNNKPLHDQAGRGGEVGV